METIRKEDFDKLSFKKIDEKVEYINTYKPLFEDIIRDLNKGIDIDYVRQSEGIETNTCNLYKLPEKCINYKVLRCEPNLPKNFQECFKTKESYLDFIENQYKKSDLIISYKDENGKNTFDILKTPSHLSSVGFALAQARQDHKILNTTKLIPNVESSFIEKVNAHLFEEKLQFGSIMGYGSFRGLMYCNGTWLKSNVKLADNAWEASDAETVYDDINGLIDKYNNSTLHPIAKAILFKVRFTKIHPFRDGNGRTSRILLNYMLARYGYPTITIYAHQREEYIKAMDTAILENNYKPLISMITKALNERCDLYIKAIRTNLAGQKTDLNP